MATYSKEIPDNRLKSSQCDEIILDFMVTGAKTARQVKGQNAPAIIAFDAGDSSQAAVDSLLGVSSDITYTTSFGTTALGSNTLGFVVAHGSAKDVLSVEVSTYQSAGGSPANTYLIFEGNRASTTALADSNANACAVTANGHLYGRFIAANLDSVTAGAVRLRIKFRAA